MKPVVQAIMASKDSRPRGDCWRACLASVLERDLDEVPHFIDLEEELGYYYLDLTNSWLRRQRYPFVVRMNVAQVARNGRSLWYVRRRGRQWVNSGLTVPGYWIMGVLSKNFKGSHHVVVGREDRIVWDPSPRFGEDQYDRRPYVFNGYYFTFHVENPHLIARAA